MDIKLSFGSIGQAMRNETAPTEPIWQILGMKKVAGQAGQERYRLHISDGEYSYSFAMLATQLNHLVHEGQVENYTVVQVDKYNCNVMNGKRIIIILGLNVIKSGAEVGTRIGNPMTWSEHGSSAPAAPQVVPQSAPKVEPNHTPQRPMAEPRSNGNSVQPKQEPQGAPRSTGLFDHHSVELPAGIEQNLVPIRDINPYVSKVTIRARVTKKGDVKTWSNSRGEGRLFSCDLIDDSGEIRITGFNQAVDSFYDVLQLNNVYYISRFSVKAANKAYSSLNHEYEIQFVNDSQVYPCVQDTEDIPTLSFNFVPIDQIEKLENNTIIDVIAICKSYGDCQTIVTKSTGKELKKRDLTLMDKSCKEITLTLWGTAAEEFKDDTQPVVAVKGAKVGDYGGRNLSVLMSSTFLINPEVPQANELRGWFDDAGNSIQAQSLTQAGKRAGGSTVRKLLAEANEVTSVDMEKDDYFLATVTLMSIKRDNAMYQACTTDKCNKKVVDLGNGMFRCEKCQKENPDFKWRSMVSCNFADITDQVWATAFQESAELIFNKSADELGEMFKNRPDEFDECVKAAMFQEFHVKFRSKMEQYNNENRKKFSILELNRINYAEYAKQLVAEIQESRQ